MKTLTITSKMYDREEGQFVQRFLQAELTPKEAELAEQLFTSIQTRSIIAWKEKGWCDDNEDSDMVTPLVDFTEDWQGDKRHRFAFGADILLEDSSDNSCKGWRGL